MGCNLRFKLHVEDEWPPVGSESLPFMEENGLHRCLAPPLFVSDLSVGDLIDCAMDDEGFVDRWIHVERSHRSVAWLLRIGPNDGIAGALQDLRRIGCNTTGSDQLGCYAADIPEEVELGLVDAVLSKLDKHSAALAFPSIRHPD